MSRARAVAEAPQRSSEQPGARLGRLCAESDLAGRPNALRDCERDTRRVAVNENASTRRRGEVAVARVSGQLIWGVRPIWEGAVRGGCADVPVTISAARRK